MISKDDILKLARELYPYQVEFRRKIHRRPELSNREFETTKAIIGELKQNKINIRKINIETGVVGEVNGKKEPVVAIRSDIDALPITEQTDLPFKSENKGVMHACGHDMHIAIVLGTALLLNKIKKEMPGSLRLIFQPAEEQPPGGAQRMIKAGALDNPRVSTILGLHVEPFIKTGQIGLRDGPMMAAVTDFDITIIGKGGHAAIPHRAVDAVSVAAEVIESAQKIISREIHPVRSGLITFGTINGGTVRNVIAEEVKLSGTARTLDEENAKQIPKLLKRTIDGICRARGAKYKLDILTGYPVMMNHPETNRLFDQCFTELFGKGKIKEAPSGLGGEDFAFYLKEIPGAMVRLGIKNTKIGANKSWHSPKFIADEEAIVYGTALLSYAVLKYMKGA